MTGGGHGYVSVQMHQAVSELAASYLKSAGHDVSVRPMGAGRRPSDILARPIAPDISGLPDIALTVTSRATLRLASDLDHARRIATVTRNDVGALLQHRAGYEIADSYIVMSFADFAKLAHRVPAPAP